MKKFAPMLAAATPGPEFDLFHNGPVLASVKVDGIRALVRDGVVLSRSLKPIPNAWVQELFGKAEYEGFDGELVVGPSYAPDVMQKTMSGVMSTDGVPAVRYFVFDLWNMPEAPYINRLALLAIRADVWHMVTVLPHTEIKTQDELDAFEAKALREGYEGCMIRAPMGAYKMGRSTAREGGLIKIKRFEQSEATVIGFEERMHNGNVVQVDNLGHTKRSTHQVNLVGRGDLGALVCVTPAGVKFNIGTGFTDLQRKDFWEFQDAFRGQLVSYRHFAASGVVEAPRFPVFVAFRDPRDL